MGASIADAKETMFRCEVSARSWIANPELNARVNSLTDPKAIHVRHYVIDDDHKTIEAIVDGKRRLECEEDCALSYSESVISMRRTPPKMQNGINEVDTTTIDRLAGILKQEVNTYYEGRVLMTTTITGPCRPESVDQRKF